MAGNVTFAGSNQIAHIVDALLFLESDTDTPLKFLRTTKNRFGDINEVGVFQHTETGLEGVSDPSGVLIDDSGEKFPGTAIAFVAEGTRQIPVEVQTLVVSTKFPSPRRQFTGLDYGRAQTNLAVVEKYGKIDLSTVDVFSNTISGYKVKDPMADVAIVAALLSSLRETALDGRNAYVGEFSLTGQVRGTMMVREKVREAERLGFDRIFVPASAGKEAKTVKGIDVVPLSSFADLVKFFPKKTRG